MDAESEVNPNPGAVTKLLREMSGGDPDAMNRLFPLVYDELRRVAANLMRRQERPGHTLQPTALVNEAYIRMVAAPDMNLVNRAHFFAIAARAMRQALVQHARHKYAGKRGGRQMQVEMDDAIGHVEANLEEVLAVDEALENLQKLDPVQAQMVEMQYFGGNSIEEISAATGTPERSTKRELQTGRLFLADQLKAKGLKFQ
jgi:RNA polymerase sigma-70 factor, ECF subfamily